MSESSADNEGKNVHWDQIDEKNVTTPRRHHVKVSHGTEGSPVNLTSLDTFDP